MTVNENKTFKISFNQDEMKSAQVINEALELMLSLIEDGELLHTETDDVLDSGDIERAQDVIRIVFSHSEGNWQS